MTSWLPWDVTSERLRIVIVAVISGTITASTILSYQRIKRDVSARQLKESIPSQSSEYNGSNVIKSLHL